MCVCRERVGRWRGKKGERVGGRKDERVGRTSQITKSSC